MDGGTLRKFGIYAALLLTFVSAMPMDSRDAELIPADDVEATTPAIDEYDFEEPLDDAIPRRKPAHAVIVFGPDGHEHHEEHHDHHHEHHDHHHEHEEEHHSHHQHEHNLTHHGEHHHDHHEEHHDHHHEHHDEHHDHHHDHEEEHHGHHQHEHNLTHHGEHPHEHKEEHHDHHPHDHNVTQHEEHDHHHDSEADVVKEEVDESTMVNNALNSILGQLTNLDLSSSLNIDAAPEDVVTKVKTQVSTSTSVKTSVSKPGKPGISVTSEKLYFGQNAPVSDKPVSSFFLSSTPADDSLKLTTTITRSADKKPAAATFAPKDEIPKTMTTKNTAEPVTVPSHIKSSKPVGITQKVVSTSTSTVSTTTKAVPTTKAPDAKITTGKTSEKVKLVQVVKPVVKISQVEAATNNSLLGLKISSQIVVNSASINKDQPVLENTYLGLKNTSKIVIGELQSVDAADFVKDLEPATKKSVEGEATMKTVEAVTEINASQKIGSSTEIDVPRPVLACGKNVSLDLQQPYGKAPQTFTSTGYPMGSFPGNRLQCLWDFQVAPTCSSGILSIRINKPSRLVGDSLCSTGYLQLMPNVDDSYKVCGQLDLLPSYTHVFDSSKSSSVTVKITMVSEGPETDFEGLSFTIQGLCADISANIKATLPKPIPISDYYKGANRIDGVTVYNADSAALTGAVNDPSKPPPKNAPPRIAALGTAEAPAEAPAPAVEAVVVEAGDSVQVGEVPQIVEPIALPLPDIVKTPIVVDLGSSGGSSSSSSGSSGSSSSSSSSDTSGSSGGTDISSGTLVTSMERPTVRVSMVQLLLHYLRIRPIVAHDRH